MKRYIFNYIFAIIAILSLLELIFVRGMFSWIFSFSLVLIFGIINIIFNIFMKNILNIFLTLFIILSICGGYLIYLI